MKNKFYYTLGVLCLSAASFFTACEDDLGVRDGIRDVTFKATADKLAITNGESIIYRDSSLNVSSRLWTFEGGNIPQSDQKEVSVSYSENGTFSTELEVTHEDGSVEKSNFNVDILPIVEPNFEADNTSVMFGSSIQFTDKTISGQSEFEEAKENDLILWEFEGGVPATSTERNPIVKYPNVGKFNVKLSVFRSSPASGGITIKEDFVDILLTPPCDNTVNLFGCNNFSAEDTNTSEWLILGQTNEDKSGNFSISQERFSEGASSYKYLYEEPGKPAFTNNKLQFINASFTVTEASDYTVTLDTYGEILSSGNLDYVFETAIIPVGTVDDQTHKEFFRTAGNTWFTASSTKNLAPGDYYLQIKIWNPGFDANLNYNLFLDNIKIIKN